MKHFGRKNLDGPIRGSSGWWQELGHLSGGTAVAPAPKKKRSSKAGNKRREGANSAIRTELVERVRREIAAGNYDTPEKWDEALDRLLDSLSNE